MIRNRIVIALALALFIVGAAVALRYAEHVGWIGDEAARRIMQVIIGLNLAGYANLMPKQLGRMRSPLVEARTQAAVRVGARALTAAGLVSAALWAVAPLWLADPASLVVVAAGILLLLAYAAPVFTACRRIPSLPEAETA